MGDSGSIFFTLFSGSITHVTKWRDYVSVGMAADSHADDETGIERKEVFADKYECPECDFTVEVADYGHRTRRQYEAPGIRCVNCTDDGISLAMVRIE